jgi:hypothetical protein
MDDIGTSLPELSKLIEQRLALLRSLAESLEGSTLALVRNDAEAIARGAAHQAELCRQWSRLEDELRREAGRRSAPPQLAHPAILRKPGTPRGCKPNGRRSELGSVISRACTGRCCGTSNAVWPS